MHLSTIIYTLHIVLTQLSLSRLNEKLLLVNSPSPIVDYIESGTQSESFEPRAENFSRKIGNFKGNEPEINKNATA